MTDDVTIYKGDSSDTFSAAVYSAGVQLTGAGLNGYTGEFTLVRKIGDTTPVLEFAMTLVSNTFQAQISPTDSATLDEGVYHVVLEVKNLAAGYRKEHHSKLIVKKQGNA